MLRVLSTHLFRNQRLHSTQLEIAARAGAQAVEILRKKESEKNSEKKKGK
jgi:hypothetical protein